MSTVETVVATNLIMSPKPVSPALGWSGWYGNGTGTLSFGSDLDGPYRRIQMSAATTSGSTGFYVTTTPGAGIDGFVSASFLTRFNQGFVTPPPRAIRLTLRFMNAANAIIGQQIIDYPNMSPATWHELRIDEAEVPAGTDNIRVGPWLVALPDMGGDVPSGTTLDVKNVMAVGESLAPPYFDGDSPTLGGYSYRWTGTPNQSPSEMVYTYEPSGTWIDQIVEELENMGYGNRKTDTVTDMERRRLLAKLSLSEPSMFTMMDLYAMADEPARIYGVKYGSYPES